MLPNKTPRFMTKTALAVESALRIRRAFVVKNKQDQPAFGRIQVANNVTLATRVKADILRAMAKQFSNDTKEKLYIIGVLSVHPIVPWVN